MSEPIGEGILVYLNPRTGTTVAVEFTSGTLEIHRRARAELFAPGARIWSATIDGTLGMQIKRYAIVRDGQSVEEALAAAPPELST